MKKSRPFVFNFDHLMPQDKRSLRRVPCHGTVVLRDKNGKIVGMGELLNLNEKSGGFEIPAVDLQVNDACYLEFLDPAYLVMSQVKVILKRVQPVDWKTQVGIEFVETTPAFRKALNKYLDKRRREMNGFGENEII